MPVRTAAALLVATLLLASPAISKTSPEAVSRSDAIEQQIKQSAADNDMASAAETAGKASAMFAAEGERYLAASYKVMKSEYEASFGKWPEIDADLRPQMEDTLRDLDTEDVLRADSFLVILMDTQGFLDRRDLQARYADRLLARVRGRSGDLSPEDLQARLRVAYSLLQTGAADEGYKNLKSALRAAGTTKHYELTISAYVQAAKNFRDTGQTDIARELYDAGLATEAARHDSIDLPNLLAFHAGLKADSGQLPEAADSSGQR